MHDDAALAQQWVTQWRRGGVTFDRVRATELARLSDPDALAAAETLLDIGASLPLPAERGELLSAFTPRIDNASEFALAYRVLRSYFETKVSLAT